jgi:hypothetical protein
MCGAHSAADSTPALSKSVCLAMLLQVAAEVLLALAVGNYENQV